MDKNRGILAGLAAAAIIAAIAGAVLDLNVTAARADDKCANACGVAEQQCLAATHDRYTCQGQRNQCLKRCAGG